MKKLEINNTHYTHLLESFKRHLQTLNYSKDTAYYDPSMVKEYLHFLIENTVELNKTDSTTVKNYVEYLQKRTNQRRGGGLSIAYLKKHVSALKRFYDYLSLTDYYSIALSFPTFQRSKNVPSVLTLKEVKQLFKICGDDLLGKRNKALLAVYYGLGLRKGEGVNLRMEEVDFDKEEVFVSKSKTRRQRRVPMSDFVKRTFEDYVYNVREKLIPDDGQTDGFLVSEHGKSLSKSSVAYIIKNLVIESKIKTHASAHTLRHSIATHLLESGMSLENIATFLGHTSLDSTQIYTHLTTKEL